MASAVYLMSMIGLSNADLQCNGFEYVASKDFVHTEGERDAIPTGVCINYGSFSYYYQCSINDTISRISFDNSDCTGRITNWIDDVCTSESIAHDYIECTEYCNLDPCDYVIQSTYYEAKSCDSDDTYTGKSPWTYNSLIQGYCNKDSAQSSQLRICNVTHVQNIAYRTPDCSGDRWYSIGTPVGDSCQTMPSWVNAYNVKCGKASDYVYEPPTGYPTRAPLEDTVVIYVTRDAEPVGEALLGTFECDGLTGHTLENDTAKIDTGSYRAFLYESPRFGRTVIYLNDQDTGRVAIEIHAGNYVKDTTGCILVGKSRGKDGDNGATWSSGVTLDALIEKCRGKNIRIEVTRKEPTTTSNPSSFPTMFPTNQPIMTTNMAMTTQNTLDVQLGGAVPNASPFMYIMCVYVLYIFWL